MKKLMFAAVACAAMFAMAEEVKEEAQIEKNEAPIFWGFGNYGVYSGYQLYGSLVNDNPTAQGYVEGNFNVSAGDLFLGYIGVGIWSNSDLTKRRSSACNELGQAFNEWDFNLHFGRTFWFDDDQTWGLEWRSFFQWYFYPCENYSHARVSNHTTWDFNHSFSLVNPYVVPYICVVREYSKGANLAVFGLKKTIAIDDGLSITPYIEGVWRERQYNWCFPTAFDSGVGGVEAPNSGIATGKIGIDCNWQLTDHFGLFAKVAYCCVCDSDLRDNCDALRDMPYSWYSYGSHKDFAWGSIGVSFNF